MSCISEHHVVLTNGVGKCSVPMWSNEMPAGFCDEPAYGKVINRDIYKGYVPSLACPAHGGPTKQENEE